VVYDIQTASVEVLNGSALYAAKNNDSGNCESISQYSEPVCTEQRCLGGGNHSVYDDIFACRYLNTPQAPSVTCTQGGFIDTEVCGGSSGNDFPDNPNPPNNGGGSDGGGANANLNNDNDEDENDEDNLDDPKPIIALPLDKLCTENCETGPEPTEDCNTLKNLRKADSLNIDILPYANQLRNRINHNKEWSVGFKKKWTDGNMKTAPLDSGIREGIDKNNSYLTSDNVIFGQIHSHP
jgi:hypothetical protein